MKMRLVATIALWLILALLLAWPMHLPAAAGQATDPPQTTRQGPWLDGLIFSEQTSAWRAISQLQADELDVYASVLDDSALFQRVLEDPDLTYTESYGAYNELTFNPAGPEFRDGRLNPFSNAKIREAMNRLIDRTYIAQHILGGGATPKFVPVSAIGADHARYRSTIEAIESSYAYNLTAAQQTISAEMLAMGAYLQGGVWHYDGQPVTLIFLIRVEDARRRIGDYVADQLETIGFRVDRQYKTRSEASPIWVGSDPADGLWHIYTGGWITTEVDRDEGDNFSFFYTPHDYPIPVHQAYQPSPEFEEAALRLRDHDFSSMAERDALFTQALLMAMNDSGPVPQGAGSLRVWLVDSFGFAPRRAGTIVASDRAGGVSGAQLFPFVARFEGIVGGTMRLAQPGLLIDPWNPIAGSYWLYDDFAIRATQDYGVIADPNTGLYRAQRVESAQCVVKAGLPVTKTLDWVDLSFAPTVPVPVDAWADWNASTQTFIRAGDMPTPKLEANVRCTVVYPSDLFSTVKWHDGSPLSPGDFVMRMIMQFDPGKPDSPIYDEAQQPSVEGFLSHFRGVKIESTQPLVITTWDDNWFLDAELIAETMTWWPNYFYGPGAWHNLTPAIRAEAAKQLAFSADKAEQLGVPWTNFIGGPSLDILRTRMNQSAAQHYIPYLPTLGAYISQAEADTRWANLQAWVAARGHFWLGTGPFSLASVQPDVPRLTLERYASFPDPAGRWDFLAAAAQPEIAINYNSGAPGSYLNVTATGFPSDSVVIVTVNNALLGTMPVDSDGSVAFTLSTAEANPGMYHLRLSVNPAAGVAFMLDETQPVRPREGDLPVIEVPTGLGRSMIYLPMVLRGY